MEAGMSDALADLTRHGVSIWVDDLSRELLAGGELTRLVDRFQVVGVTSNPTIFANALTRGERYTDQIRALAGRGASVEEAVFEITTADVQAAADLLGGVYEATARLDGRVSLEVDPRLAHDTERTTEAARLLWHAVDRPNIMIKIPATPAGLSHHGRPGRGSASM
jgi:transaldolase